MAKPFRWNEVLSGEADSWRRAEPVIRTDLVGRRQRTACGAVGKIWNGLAVLDAKSRKVRRPVDISEHAAPAEEDGQHFVMQRDIASGSGLAADVEFVRHGEDLPEVGSATQVSTDAFPWRQQLNCKAVGLGFLAAVKIAAPPVRLAHVAATALKALRDGRPMPGIEKMTELVGDAEAAARMPRPSPRSENHGLQSETGTPRRYKWLPV